MTLKSKWYGLVRFGNQAIMDESLDGKTPLELRQAILAIGRVCIDALSQRKDKPSITIYLEPSPIKSIDDVQVYDLHSFSFTDPTLIAPSQDVENQPLADFPSITVGELINMREDSQTFFAAERKVLEGNKLSGDELLSIARLCGNEKWAGYLALKQSQTQR